MSRMLEIDSRIISDDTDCYVIAEIGHNHQGDMAKAKLMFDAAKASGADAVKLQKRDNRALYTKEMFDSAYVSENAYAETYGLHREALEFGHDEYVELKRYAAGIGITFFATAFDLPSVDFLAELDMPAYKIASADVVNTPLIRYIAETGKPIVLSTGGASIEDVDRAWGTISAVNSQIAVLQCTASYPAEPEDMDLRVIETYRERYPDAVVGLSDHQNGIAMSTVAYVLGARVVEKHFTLNRAWKGTDQAFSLEPGGLTRLVRDLHRARVALGNGSKQIHDSERSALYKMTKSLVAHTNLPAGHTLDYGDIAIKSPGGGMEPYLLDEIIGRTLVRSMKQDEPFSPDAIA